MKTQKLINMKTENVLQRFKRNLSEFGGSLSIRKITKSWCYDDGIMKRLGYKRVWISGNDRGFRDAFRDACIKENESKCIAKFGFGRWVLEDNSYEITLILRDHKYQWYIKKIEIVK